MFYWIIQVYKGNVSAIGPYKTESACRNRYDRIQGGEIHEFRSESESASEAIDEFKVEMARGTI